MKESDSFQKVVNRSKGRKRGPKNQQREEQQFRQNSFQVLQEEEENTKEEQAMEGSSAEKEEGKNPKQTQNDEYQKEATMSDVEQEMDQEMTQNDTDPEDHELLEILDKENLDLEGFLRQGTTGGVDSLPQEELSRIQQLFLWRSQTGEPKRCNNIDKQDNREVKMTKTTLGLVNRNPGKKRGRKKQNELLMECRRLMINSGKMKDLASYSFTNLLLKV